MKSDKNVLTKLSYISAAVYLAIWVAAIAVYWLAVGPTDIMGYSVLFLLILLPAANFLISLIFGMRRDLGAIRLAVIPIMTAMYLGSQSFTFSISNLIGKSNVSTTMIFMLLLPIVVSAAGTALGYLIGELKNGAKTRPK